MKDDIIQGNVDKLKTLVDEVNEIMKKLQELNVEVRINYVDKKSGVEPCPQSIALWKVEERNNYLKDE
jgi:uncharacterized protein YoxC